VIGLPETIAGVIAVALNAYVLTGGADFGGGVWDLFATGVRRERQRELIAESIAPIWEANHVWLIVVVVVLFTGFPSAFSTLGTVLHIPITIMLIGIVLRGSAFVFRSYGPYGRNRWGLAFAIASVITPLLLGSVIGSIATGAVAAAADKIGDAASFAEVFVRPWAAAFPAAVGFFALALFAFLAATYLTVDAQDQELQEDFRTRALAAAGAVFVCAAVALALAHAAAPRVAIGVVGALLIQVATASAAITAIAALWLRQYRLARIAAAAQVSLILWGWMIAQYPYLIPPTLTIRDAAAPAVTLRLLAAGLAGGAVILLPSLRYLMRTFKGGRPGPLGPGSSANLAGPKGSAPH
jgi:cytochrome d ubiquinol oxidase subunit II